MTLQELQSLVREGEHSTLEFKRKANHPDKIMKEVVAFANTQGGTLLVGVDDNGSIPGVKHVEEEYYVLEQALDRYCRPKVDYSLSIIRMNDLRGVLYLQVKESDRKPHVVIENLTTGKGIAYVRVADRSMQASKEAREILRRRRKNKDIQFTFGEKERLLMEYLAEHSFITLPQFSKLARLNRYRAARTLILLVLANVLDLIPQETGEDHYKIKPDSSYQYQPLN
ncbi:MAG TPA: ATP-binding protein [Cytophagales bacterium]|nr:ATP-binding protein [Cytophagales bacterium]HAA24406.1 ATP-binding protein [Cytophagales bacterium]HAP59690.1 ATP-binding protein [Cytophagales bacterium]